MVRVVEVGAALPAARWPGSAVAGGGGDRPWEALVLRLLRKEKIGRSSREEEGCREREKAITKIIKEVFFFIFLKFRNKDKAIIQIDF